MSHGTFIVVHTMLALLATAFIGARFSAKRITAKRVKRFHWTLDDALLLGALVFLYIMFAGCIIAVTVGKVGYHISTLSRDEVETTLLILWLLNFPHAIALTLVRWAIVVFFARTFFTHMYPWLRRIAHCCLVLSITWLVTMIIINSVHCRPIKHSWKLPIENPLHCFPLKPYTIYQAAFGLVLDAVIWSLPHFVVWTLRLRPAHKIAITTIFALGLINIIVAAFCIVSLLSVEFRGDITYDWAPVIIWNYTQISTAIVLACCPLLRPVFEKLVPVRLTRVTTQNHARTMRPLPVRNPSTIRVTTRIHVDNNSSTRPDYQACFLKGDDNPHSGPTYEVEMSQPHEERVADWCPCH